MSQHESAPARPLYDEVERMRLRNGWTRVQLAKKAGVGRNTIDNWRTQPRAPLAPTVKDVAERLGIDADHALRLAGILGTEQPAEPKTAEPSLSEVMDRMTALAEEVKELRQRDEERERQIAEELERLRGQQSG